MKTITNKTSQKFVDDIIKELVDENLPLSSLRNIETFMNGDFEAISENIKERLQKEKQNLYAKTEKIINENYTTISAQRDKLKDYEQDLQMIEQFKMFKRKSKIN